MMASTLPAGVYAQGNEPNSGIMPLYESSSKAVSAIKSTGKNVECISNIVVYSTETWVSITQTIEKKSSSGSWTSTKYTWSKTADNSSIGYIFTNSTNISDSGTYRLRSDLVVKMANGTKETVTSHSGTITI